MLVGKTIAVISSNRLTGLGLKSLLTEYFAPEKVTILPAFTASRLHDAVDYIFLDADAYVRNHEELAERAHRVIVLSENGAVTGGSIPPTVDVTRSESDLVDRLRQIFAAEQRRRGREAASRLTAREIDVLKLVALGNANKEIADRLRISLHTVISHRKNLTRKLGIKTVSGLTMYAVLNGHVSMREVK